MDMPGDVSQVAIALLFIVGLVLVLGYIARRVQSRQQNSTGDLAVIDSVMLGPKERLLVVRFAKQQILVGVNASCIARLGTAPLEPTPSFESILEEPLSMSEAHDHAA